MNETKTISEIEKSNKKRTENRTGHSTPFGLNKTSIAPFIRNHTLNPI